MYYSYLTCFPLCTNLLGLIPKFQVDSRILSMLLEFFFLQSILGFKYINVIHLAAYSKYGPWIRIPLPQHDNVFISTSIWLSIKYEILLRDPLNDIELYIAGIAGGKVV